MNSFTITIEDFSGPIDALLQIIEKRKMPINEISLAEITDSYIDFVGKLDDYSFSNKTHFIFIASILTLIKSKSLLPTLDLTQEEKGDITELKRRIALLKEFQKGSNTLNHLYQLRPQFYYAKPSKRYISFKPDVSIEKQNLVQTMNELLCELPEQKNIKKEASITLTIHIEEMMNSLKNRITDTLKINFNDFIGTYVTQGQHPKETKVYKVVGFLAMLELVKNKVLDVMQKKNFSSIEIETI